MLETDPIAQASTSLVNVCLEVVSGGDPNRIKGPLLAYLRAKGQGKQAMAIAALPPMPYVKPKRTP